MKVFITGASGFIGANLVKELVARGDKVHILTRPNSDLWRLTPILKRLHCHRADIQNKKAIEKIISRIKPAIIYHLSVYGAYHYQTDTEQIFRTALNGTLNLLLTAKKAGVKMFINTGSSSEYGRKNHPMCENEILEPNTYYAVAKAGQTLLCQNFAVSEKLPVITLRLFSVYGAYEEPGRLIPTLSKTALSGQKLSLASPKIARDFIYVKDVIRAYMMAARRPDLTGQIFNIGSGRQTNLKQIADEILQLTESYSKIVYRQYAKRSFDTDIWLANAKKTADLLKFKPDYDLRTGLTETIDWFKKHSDRY